MHSESNHPPAIIKNIPVSVNKRLSKISANEEIFNAATPLFQAELDRNGYKEKKRTRNQICFNPPYSMNVKQISGQNF